MASVRVLHMPGGTVSAQLLDPVHYASFQTALSNLLSTEIARETIAQLMDGLPLYSVLREAAGANNLSGAPIQQHNQLCEGAEKCADDFISSFDVNLLQFDASLLQAFQHSEPETDNFLYRLLELLARSVHCIAASIDITATKCHAGDIQAATTYHQPPMMVPVGRNLRAYPSPQPRGSLFFHRKYKSHEHYPFGKADMAGYWAEDRIFGGVVLFDRGASGTEAHSVWLHSGRKGWTKRIWKPLDWQIRCMANFFAGSSAEAIAGEGEQREMELPLKLLEEMNERWKMTFPFFCDVDNLERHDDYDAMAYHNIYRDRWERQLPPTKPQMCTQNTFDYPELQPLMDAIIFYPVPDTVPTVEDLNYPRIIPADQGSGLEESSNRAQDSGKMASDISQLEQADSDVFGNLPSSGNSGKGSPPASSVRDSPDRRSTSQHGSDGPQNTQCSENIIGHFEGGRFHYAGPDFDIDKRIKEVVQGWRQRDGQHKSSGDGQQSNDFGFNGENGICTEDAKEW